MKKQTRWVLFTASNERDVVYVERFATKEALLQELGAYLYYDRKKSWKPRSTVTIVEV